MMYTVRTYTGRTTHVRATGMAEARRRAQDKLAGVFRAPGRPDCCCPWCAEATPEWQETTGYDLELEQTTMRNERIAERRTRSWVYRLFSPIERIDVLAGLLERERYERF